MDAATKNVTAQKPCTTGLLKGPLTESKVNHDPFKRSEASAARLHGTQQVELPELPQFRYTFQSDERYRLVLVLARIKARTDARLKAGRATGVAPVARRHVETMIDEANTTAESGYSMAEFAGALINDWMNTIVGHDSEVRLQMGLHLEHEHHIEDVVPNESPWRLCFELDFRVDDEYVALAPAFWALESSRSGVGMHLLWVLEAVDVYVTPILTPMSLIKLLAYAYWCGADSDKEIRENVLSEYSSSKLSVQEIEEEIQARLMGAGPSSQLIRMSQDFTRMPLAMIFEDFAEPYLADGPFRHPATGVELSNDCEDGGSSLSLRQLRWTEADLKAWHDGLAHDDPVRDLGGELLELTRLLGSDKDMYALLQGRKPDVEGRSLRLKQTLLFSWKVDEDERDQDDEAWRHAADEIVNSGLDFLQMDALVTPQGDIQTCAMLDYIEKTAAILHRLCLMRAMMKKREGIPVAALVALCSRRQTG